MAPAAYDGMGSDWEEQFVKDYNKLLNSHFLISCGRHLLTAFSVVAQFFFLAINECDSSPCQNGARCFDYNNGYLCMCAAGWTGPTCDQGRYLCLSVCLLVCL